MKIQSFYDLSVYILGEMPTQFQFLNAIFAFILALIFTTAIMSIFFFFFRKMSRW